MLWQECLNKLESELSDQEINTWLRTLHGTQHENILVLLAPNTFVYQHVKDHHLETIKDIVKLLSDENNIQVILQIGAGETMPFSQSIESQPTDLNFNNDKISRHAQKTVHTPAPIVNQKSFTQTITPIYK
jgi:chromosomal replication initiator protein